MNIEKSTEYEYEPKNSELFQLFGSYLPCLYVFCFVSILEKLYICGK